MPFAEFLSAVDDDVTTAEGLRAAWRAWASVHARDEAEPAASVFAAAAERRIAAQAARTSDRPLSFWRFAGTLRASQRETLDAITVTPGEPLHLVAPPGSGKTLIGLLLAARRGARAVVFAPTTTIRDQWTRQARDLAPDPATVTDDVLGDLTVLTYQRVSVPDASDAFAPIARAAWLAELSNGDGDADGDDGDDAEAWLSDLEQSNPKAYANGIARRSRAARKRLARTGPAELARALHPNARALVDELVAHGVSTVVLDECHHLLDHWALVIAYLAARIGEAGRKPLLIGLTATLPSEQDAAGYENYTELLGDVDHEEPAPAVVREGNLAPYRDVAWFVSPTGDERVFLAERDRLLAVLVANTLGSADGVGFLHALLGDDVDGVAAAFAADFPAAEAASAMLRLVAPDDPLLEHLPESSLLIGDGELRLIARYLLTRVLPDPAREDDWQRARRTLADFGYVLTDRGIRRGRDPIDALLATSRAKDDATAEIIAYEQAQLGDRLRAVVVTDVARHGARAGVGAERAGALRTFGRLAADERFAALMPVLVTSRHLRVATRDLSSLLPRLRDELGVLPVLGETDDAATELRVPGVTHTAVLVAVSRLVERGFVRVLVGTRGLLGEGWDCPAVNTLVDLTTASTSTASQQLRGRTMRLDPGWPEKVAHNWSVVALAPGLRADNAAGDVRRLRRKLAAQWGVRVEGEPDIVRGGEHTLTAAQLRALRSGSADAAALTAMTLDALPPRAVTRERWRLGTVVVGSVHRRAVSTTPRAPRAVLVPPTFENSLAGVATGTTVAGAACLVAGVTLIATPLGIPALVAGALALGASIAPWRRRAALGRARGDADTGTAAVAGAVVAGLIASGAVRPGVAVSTSRAGSGDVAVQLDGATPGEQEAFRDAYLELVSPVSTPRFIIELDRGREGGPLMRLALRLASARDGHGTLLAVPTRIGRRRASAEAFAARWRQDVGPVTLHELTTTDDTRLLVEARRTSSARETFAFRRDVWD